MLEQQVEQELLSDEEQVANISPGSEPSEPPLSPSHLSIAPPPDFREISTLASWTVSSSKPGCSIPQLRHPSPSLFWQSDGPQPHYLNIHFFKLVRIVGLRLYLDFEQDESYTPTRIVLLAGSGMNDLVEWGEMKLESPRGWVWADFSGVGDPDDDDETDDSDGDGEGGNDANDVDMQDAVPAAEPPWEAFRDAPPTDDISDYENTAPRATPAATAAATATAATAATPTPNTADTTPRDPHTHPNQTTTPLNLAPQTTPSLPRPHPRAPFATLSPHAPPQRTAASSSPRKQQKLPTLRCHLVQIKILENHQNGKDTHLRGLQIFAREGDMGGGNKGRVGSGLGTGAGFGMGMGKKDGRGEKGAGASAGERRAVRGLAGGEWMDEAVLR